MLRCKCNVSEKNLLLLVEALNLEWPQNKYHEQMNIFKSSQVICPGCITCIRVNLPTNRDFVRLVLPSYAWQKSKKWI